MSLQFDNEKKKGFLLQFHTKLENVLTTMKKKAFASFIQGAIHKRCHSGGGVMGYKNGDFQCLNWVTRGGWG